MFVLLRPTEDETQNITILSKASPAQRQAKTPTKEGKRRTPPPHAGMTKPAASLASLLPQLWHRPFPPLPLLPRALYSSAPLLTTHRIPRRRFPTTHLDAAATARATRAADPVESLTATS